MELSYELGLLEHVEHGRGWATTLPVTRPTRTRTPRASSWACCWLDGQPGWVGAGGSTREQAVADRLVEGFGTGSGRAGMSRMGRDFTEVLT